MSRILIAIPCMSGFEPNTLESIVNLIRYTRDSHRITGTITIRESMISRARNLIAHAFLESDNDYLLFIDSDIVFPKDALIRLLRYNESVVFSAYTDWQYERNSMYRYTVAQLGFCLIARNAFTSILQSQTIDSYDYYTQRGVKGFFNPFIKENRFYTEYESFSYKLHKANISIAGDSNINLGHVKRQTM